LARHRNRSYDSAVAKPAYGLFPERAATYPDSSPSGLRVADGLSQTERIRRLGVAARVTVGMASRDRANTAYVLAHIPGERTRVRHADGRVAVYKWSTLQSWPLRATWHRRQIKFRVLVFGEAETHPCGYCGTGLAFPDSTVDHVIAQVFGGPDTLENYALACQPCNVSKGCSSTWRVIFPHAPLPDLLGRFL
jgi:5-methylcytosine-specific restriction endonuclease McrA